MYNYTLDCITITVIQPEHSRQKLNEYEEKYGIKSADLFPMLREYLILPISEQELRDWQFQYEMYCITNKKNKFMVKEIKWVNNRRRK